MYPMDIFIFYMDQRASFLIYFREELHPLIPSIIMGNVNLLPEQDRQAVCTEQQADLTEEQLVHFY